MNQLNALHGDEPNDTPIEWNTQPPASHLKYRTYPPKTSPVVSAIMGRLNHPAIDDGGVEVHPSELRFEYNSESVPYPDTTLIK